MNTKMNIKPKSQARNYDLKRSYFIDMLPDKQKFIANIILLENDYYNICCQEFNSMLKNQLSTILADEHIYKLLENFIKLGVYWKHRNKILKGKEDSFKELESYIGKLPRLEIALESFTKGIKIPLENKAEIFKNVLQGFRAIARSYRDNLLLNNDNYASKPTALLYPKTNRKIHDILRHNCKIDYNEENECSYVTIIPYGLKIKIENYDLRNMPDWQYLKLSFLNRKDKSGYWSVTFCKKDFLSLESFK